MRSSEVIDGLPTVPSSALPATVRDASNADRDAYKAALGFEQILLGRMVEEIVPAGGGPYGSQVQDAFTAGLVNAGGIGLAASLYPSLRKDAA
jgi:hypothetical protein